VPQSLLEAGQDRFLVVSFDIDDAVRLQPCLGDRRREEIGSGNAPQDLAVRSSGDARHKQARYRTINRSGAPSSDLVQRPERQASTR